MSTDPKDGSDLNPDNIIAVTLEDLPSDERQKLEQELEEERVEKLKQKLAGFQRTRNSVIQKVATPSHPAGVSKTACTEEIAHLIDASVASKYGKQMTDMARTITESVVSKFDEFREQFNKDIQVAMPIDDSMLLTNLIHGLHPKLSRSASSLSLTTSSFTDTITYHRIQENASTT